MAKKLLMLVRALLWKASNLPRQIRSSVKAKEVNQSQDKGKEMRRSYLANAFGQPRYLHWKGFASALSSSWTRSVEFE